jgi:hypothetical protein
MNRFMPSFAYKPETLSFSMSLSQRGHSPKMRPRINASSADAEACRFPSPGVNFSSISQCTHSPSINFSNARPELSSEL